MSACYAPGCTFPKGHMGRHSYVGKKKFNPTMDRIEAMTTPLPDVAEIMRLADEYGMATRVKDHKASAVKWCALEAKVTELAHALDAEIGRNAALRVMLAEAQKKC